MITHFDSKHCSITVYQLIYASYDYLLLCNHFPIFLLFILLIFFFHYLLHTYHQKFWKWKYEIKNWSTTPTQEYFDQKLPWHQKKKKNRRVSFLKGEDGLSTNRPLTFCNNQIERVCILVEKKKIYNYNYDFICFYFFT